MIEELGVKVAPTPAPVVLVDHPLKVKSGRVGPEVGSVMAGVAKV